MATNKDLPVNSTDEAIEAGTIIKENKESFLSNLRRASQTTGFSAKKIRQSADVPKKKHGRILSEDVADSVMDIPERVDTFDDDKWEALMTAFDEISPIDDITDEERNYYRRKSGGDSFDDMFTKERSMLSDVLSDIQKRSKLINTKINSMGGKGSYGVSKNFVDLVEAGTSMDTAKMQIIDKMANLKKTAADLRLKAQKASPDQGVGESKDSMADKFYKSIISGGTKQFIQSSVGDYKNYDIDSGDESDSKFNITQPIRSNDNDGSGYDIDSVDKYGYLRNETKNVEICLNRYEDGSIEFVALDDDNQVVNNYELPNEMLLDTIEFKPASKYAYDKYQRKYRIIDINSTVTLGDIDDDGLDDVSNDDKYNY